MFFTICFNSYTVSSQIKIMTVKQIHSNNKTENLKLATAPNSCSRIELYSMSVLPLVYITSRNCRKKQRIEVHYSNAMPFKL